MGEYKTIKSKLEQVITWVLGKVSNVNKNTEGANATFYNNLHIITFNV